MAKSKKSTKTTKHKRIDIQEKENINTCWIDNGTSLHLCYGILNFLSVIFYKLSQPPHQHFATTDLLLLQRGV